MTEGKEGRHRDRLGTRAWNQIERRALNQARRVPWTHIAEGSDKYTEWHIFTLWLRAVVDAARAVPKIVEAELKARDPHLLEAARLETARLKVVSRLGTRLWEYVTQWANTNVFLSAKIENWLEAVHYFSSLSLRSMKAWAYWERTDERWQQSAPAAFPSYEEWRAAVESVKTLSGPESLGQQVLEAISRVNAQKWKELETTFFDLTLFCLWMELVVEVAGKNSSILDRELLARYPGFKPPEGFVRSKTFIGSKTNVQALHRWVLHYHLAEARENDLLMALSYHVRNHPRYHAVRRYAQHCHRAWQESPPSIMPGFKEWTHAGDQYVECK